eukprot:gene24566-biopygen19434
MDTFPRGMQTSRRRLIGIVSESWEYDAGEGSPASFRRNTTCSSTDIGLQAGGRGDARRGAQSLTNLRTREGLRLRE